MEARLGFAIDSSQAVSAKGNLEKMSAASKQAEAATKQLAGAAKTAGTQWGTYEQAVARLGIKTKEMDTVSRAASTAVTQLNAGMTREAGNARAVAQAQTMVATATEKAAVATRSLTIASRAAGMHSRQLMYQLVDMGQAIPLAFQSPIYALQNFGFQIAQVGQLYYGQGGMRAALRDMTTMVGRFASKFAPVAAAVGTVAAGIAALRSEINETSKVTVSFGDVAIGVWQTVRDAVYTTVEPAVTAISNLFAKFWDWFGERAKEELNLFIGNAVQLAEQMKFAVVSIQTYWTAGFETIKTVWGGLPAALGDVVYATAQNVISGIESMVQKAVDGLNNLTNKYALWRAGIGKPLDPETFNKMTIGPVNFGKPLENPYANSATDLRKQLGDIWGTANQNVSDAYGAMQDRVSAAKSTDYFGALQQNSVANALKRIAEEAKGTGKSLKDAAKDALPAWMQFGRATDAARDAMRFVGRTARGFIDDFTNGLKNGESVWRSFADAALNALNRIADKLLDEAFADLFGYGKGGGLLSSLFGLGGGVNYFPPAPTPAIGLFASGTPSAPPGLAIVGERGPELVRFRGGEEVIPNHRLRAANDSAANQNAPQPVYINVNVAGARGNAEISQMVERGVRSGIDEFSRKGLPVRVQQIRNDPRARG